MPPDGNERYKTTGSGEPVSNMETDHIITLNIGGRVFQTKASTLTRVGTGRLATLSKTDPSYNETTGEFFFDRDPYYFRLVLQFYRMGTLHVDRGHCGKALRKELSFWGLGDKEIGECCWRNVCETRERELEFRELKELAIAAAQESVVSKNPTLRQSLWLLLDNPASSIPAKIWFVLSIVLIFISISCYAINTLPSIKSAIQEKLKRPNNALENCSNATSLQDVGQTLFILNVIDTCCLAFFTIDVILRTISAPQRLVFLKSFLFISDVFFIVPGWVMVGLMFTDIMVWLPKLHNNMALHVIQVASLTRISRVVRLGWYSHGFRTLILVLKKSSSELFALGNILLISVAVFGFMVYSAEVGTNNDFDSAFRGFWWSAITMTTVGYGDIFPTSPLGCIVGGACAVSGIIIIGLLIPIIARNFRVYYRFRNINFPLKSTWDAQPINSEKKDTVKF